MADTRPSEEMIRHMQAAEEQWIRASKSLAAIMPQEMVGAFNLMAHPAAMMSASTVLGLGATSQAAGLWLGAWAGAAENWHRVVSAPLAANEKLDNAAAKRVRAAAETLIADAKSLAEEVSRPAARQPARKAKAESAKPAVAEKVDDAASAQPKAEAKPDKPDDLKLITGVGPKLEQVLNSLGIWTYQRVAELSSAEIDWIEDYLSFKGRITRDDWLGQAAKLAGGSDAS